MVNHPNSRTHGDENENKDADFAHVKFPVQCCACGAKAKRGAGESFKGWDARFVAPHLTIPSVKNVDRDGSRHERNRGLPVAIEVKEMTERRHRCARRCADEIPAQLTIGNRRHSLPTGLPLPAVPAPCCRSGLPLESRAVCPPTPARQTCVRASGSSGSPAGFE